MKEFKWTHVGYLVGHDARTPKGARHTIRLRETKLYYIAEHGQKYHKSNGYAAPYEDWPMWGLDLDSVQLRGDDQ